MLRVRPSFAATAMLATALAWLPAQAPAQTPQAAAPDESIVVEARKKAVVEALRQMIKPSEHAQFARFEDRMCPMVIGMPREWTTPMTRMIRNNIVAAGGKLAKAGCKPNAIAIFIDQPTELIHELNKDSPFFFANMTPREFDYFAAEPGPVWSWHISDMFTRDGVQPGVARIGGHDVAVVRDAAASRLYSNIRDEMLGGFVIIDRQKTIGTTIRQLSDLATMHLMLDVKPQAGAADPSSILSLFEQRPDGAAAPARLSRFDRGALAGLYTQRENNRTAYQQRENIARAITKGAGQEPAEPKP